MKSNKSRISIIAFRATAKPHGYQKRAALIKIAVFSVKKWLNY